MSLLVQLLIALIPTMGGVYVEWLRARDRQRHRQALLAAKGDPALIEAIDEQTQPPKTPHSTTATLLLLALGLGLSGQVPAEPEYAAAPSGRRCSTSADCEPPARCRRGICEADAHKRPIRNPYAFDDTDLALWLRPRHEERDPFAPPLLIRMP